MKINKVNVLSFIETGERFGFYTIQSLLVLYLIAAKNNGGFALNETLALQVIGYYGILAYISPLIGGYVSGNVINNKLATLLGLIFMTVGSLIICLPFIFFLIIGLGFLVIGCGFIKPSITAMIGEIYHNNDSQKDVAFSIYYMSIYIGAFFAPLISGFIALKFGFHIAFIINSSYLMVCISVLLLVWNSTLQNTGNKIGIVLPDKENNCRKKTVAYFSLCISNILSNIYYVLPYGLLTIHTEHNINRHIGQFEIPSTWYVAFHTLVVIIFCFSLTKIYKILFQKYEIILTLSVKLAIGYFIMAVALFLMIPFFMNLQKYPGYIGNQTVIIIFYVLFALNKAFNTPSLLGAASSFASSRKNTAIFAAYNMSISWGLGYFIGTAIITYCNKSFHLVTFLIVSIILCILFAIIHILTNHKIEAICNVSRHQY